MEPIGEYYPIFIPFVYVLSILGFILLFRRRYKNRTFKFTWQSGVIKLDLKVLAGGIAVGSIITMKAVLLLLDLLV